MRTVVMFVNNRRQQDDTDRNSVITRTLRKVGFIDNRYASKAPQANEHWLVEIVRENTANSGGCFILLPVEKLDEGEYHSLVHGSYDMDTVGDSVVLTPHMEGFWVISPEAKTSILEATQGARSIVINHGGEDWKRREPAESLLSSGAKKVAEGF